MVDIIKILEEAHVPEGAKFFSLAYGEVEFQGFRFGSVKADGVQLLIRCVTRRDEELLYDKFGRFVNHSTYKANEDSICVLYPWKLDDMENRIYSPDMWCDLPELSTDTLERLKEISEQAPSDWREHAKWRQENRYWTRYSGYIALYLFMCKGGTCGVHDYIKEKLGCDDSTVRQICKGDYDFKMSEVLKLVTPEELSNIISGGYKYLKDKEEKNGDDC